MRRATTATRRRQRATGIENEQITRPQVIVDLIETRVLDAAGRALDHEQAHLIATDPAALRRLFRAQFRRQREGKRRSHQKNFRTKSTTVTKRSEERRVGKECRSRWSPY